MTRSWESLFVHTSGTKAKVGSYPCLQGTDGRVQRRGCTFLGCSLWRMRSNEQKLQNEGIPVWSWERKIHDGSDQSVSSLSREPLHSQPVEILRIWYHQPDLIPGFDLLPGPVLLLEPGWARWRCFYSVILINLLILSSRWSVLVSVMSQEPVPVCSWGRIEVLQFLLCTTPSTS